MAENKPIKFQWAINHAIAEEMRRDPSVFIVGEDVGKPGGPFGVTRGLIDEFGPERCVDTPISEGSIIGLCCGASASGLRPVAEIMFMNFITLAVEELYNQASKMHWMFGGQVKQPFVVRAMTAGGFGAGPHHSSSLEGWFASMPGLKVVMPSNPEDAKGLLKAAIRDDNTASLTLFDRLGWERIGDSEMERLASEYYTSHSSRPWTTQIRIQPAP